MPSPPVETALVERRVALRELLPKCSALAASLGELGVPALRIEELLSSAVTASCLTCGITVRGTDLIATTLADASGTGLHEKQRRLRLGYCARKTCGGGFYTVHLSPVPDLAWESAWTQASTRAESTAPTLELAPAGPSFARQVAELLGSQLRPLLRPLPLFLLAGLLVGAWIRSGARIPGISAPPRVFVVPDNGAKLPARAPVPR